MNKYNERILKNVLEDIREENDIKLQREAEDAATNPLFANNEETDRRFQEALKEINKRNRRKQHRKTLLRVASVFLAILIGLSAVTLSVDAFREKLWEFVSNIGNSSHFSFIASDNRNETMLSEYEGAYIPSWVPEGYEIVSINNSEVFSSIDYQNESGNVISFIEHRNTLDTKINIDKENMDTCNTLTIGGKDAIITVKDNVTTLIIKEQDMIIEVVFDDKNINAEAFAEKIEKK